MQDQNSGTNLATEGYEVRPSENGGFVVFPGNREPGYYRGSSGFYAFSNYVDLMSFLLQAHSNSSSEGNKQ